MNRIIPYPIFSLALLAMWLLLHATLAPLMLLSGALLAIAAPWSLSSLETNKLRLASLTACFKLAGVVLFDIIRSNIAVATIIFGRKHATRTSGFVTIPLDLRNHYGLTLLAIIITCTPGTLWAQYDGTSGRLLLHVLDLVDRASWVPLIKGRYEGLLMEIFE